MDPLFDFASYMEPPLEVAARNGNLPRFIQLLDQPEIRSKLTSGMLGHDCLHLAIMHGHEEIVKALISLPLSEFDFTRVPLENLGAISYLSRAANAQQPAIFKTIAESGKVSITERNGNGCTAFHYACNAGCLQIVDFLLQHEGVNPDERDNKNRTPLFFAAMEGSQEVTRRLLGLNGVNPDAQDDDGKTPLYWATFYGHSAVAKILEDSGRVDRSIMARALEDRRAGQQSEPAFTWHVLQ